MRRMLAAATVASLTFATFAGCSSQGPSARSTPAPLVCSPSDSVITWTHGFAPDPVLIGAYEIAFDYDARRWASTYHAIPVSPSWDDQAIPQAATSILAQRTWRSALLADADKTGQVPADFGTVATISETAAATPPAVPSRVDKHTFIAAVLAKQYTMPFSIKCGAPSRKTVSGTVTASITGEYSSALYQCGNEPSSEVERLALRYCPAGR